MFVGCDGEIPAYLMYIPGRRELIMERFVKFCKTNMQTRILKEEGGDFQEESELHEAESATREEEEQDAEDNTNHEAEDKAEEPDARYPIRTHKPTKHLTDYIIDDDVEAVDTARCSIHDY